VRPVVVTYRAAHEISAADDWWRANRPAAAGLLQNDYHGIPDSLRIDRDCTPIDDSAFREFVLQATPRDEASWKGERLVVGRSELAGDRYFFISNYGGFFERPGVRGIYVVPENERDEWDALILRKSSH